MKTTHGGRRTPGPGKKIGRPLRGQPKGNPIWCGQLSKNERELILAKLTPDERREVLLKAAQEKP